MAAVTKKKKTAARKQLLIAAVIGFCTLLIVFALVSLSVTPVKYDISVGEVAPVSLTASRDVIDTVSTNADTIRFLISRSFFKTIHSVPLSFIFMRTA